MLTYSHLTARAGRGSFAVSGALGALAAVLKVGRREDLLPHSAGLLAVIAECNLANSPNTLTRKLAVKLIQVCALCVQSFCGIDCLPSILLPPAHRHDLPRTSAGTLAVPARPALSGLERGWLLCVFCGAQAFHHFHRRRH